MVFYILQAASPKYLPVTAGMQLLASNMGLKQNNRYLKEFLADRTIGRAFGTVSRLSVVCLSVRRL